MRLIGQAGRLHRREFLAKGAAGVGLALIGPTSSRAFGKAKRNPKPGAPQPAPVGEVFYNGIQLPATWPPQNLSLTPDPTPPPYLLSPPAVILIDVGRQLFVDDFLIEHTTLKRTFHTTEYHPATPVLIPDRP